MIPLGQERDPGSSARRVLSPTSFRRSGRSDNGPFTSLGKGTINLGLIRENWSDMIRLAGSLKFGHLKAAGIIRTPQVRNKPTTLARALSEIGKIAKMNPYSALCRRSGLPAAYPDPAQPTELHHRLGRRIHHDERGEIRSALRQGQEKQLGSLGLALNAVVHRP